VAALVERHATEHPGRPALIDEHGTTTWAELDDRVNRAVHALDRLGLDTHDTVALMSGNRREFFEVFAAAANGGWLVVPVNWHWVADELAHVIEDSASVALLVDERFLEVAVAARADERTRGCTRWIVLGGTPPPEGFLSWDELLAAAPSTPPEEPVMGGPMFYTSGTTGFPKGVRSGLTRTGAPAELLELIAAGFNDMLGLPAGGVTLLDGPAYHSAQWAFSVFPLLGGSTVVMRHGFDPSRTLELIDEHRVTNVHLVPTQFVRLLQLPDEVRDRFDGSSLQVVFHGAAPCPRPVKERMLAWWGPVVWEYYGGTEGGFLTLISGEDWQRRPGSIGTATSMAELVVLDDDGEECPRGVSGQLWFRSRTGNDFEYHGDPDKTARAHREGGWGTLGDVGHCDEEGYFFLSDRKIDMIISGGVNIYPAEIESVLAGHPAVADVAVFGVPDDEMGESVAAAIELVAGETAGDARRAQLQDHARRHLAGYKVPKLIEFREQLPRTATGKLLKRELRDPYWVGAGRTI
jgi:long-chain acyl-CoA synthetase